jgi:hypothetical protein
MSNRAHYLTTVEWYNLNWCIQPICKAFGYQVYLVGSCLNTRDFRDVDIRIIHEKYEGVLASDHNRKMFGMMMSEWLMNRTGLNIDLQLQTMAEADEFKGNRNALGVTV